MTEEQIERAIRKAMRPDVLRAVGENVCGGVILGFGIPLCILSVWEEAPLPPQIWWALPLGLAAACGALAYYQFDRFPGR